MNGPQAEIAVESSLDQRELLEISFSSRQLAGREPHAIEFTRLDTTVPPADLLPSDAEIVGTFRRAFDIVVHAVTPRGSIRIEIDSHCTTVTVTSSHLHDCEVLAEEIGRRCWQPPGHQIPINIWSLSRASRLTRHRKHIEPLPWATIRHNYPPTVMHRLDELMAMTPPAAGGRLILFHGKPGTGKTHAVRALIEQWQTWCAFDLLSEPETQLRQPTLIERVISEGPIKVVRVARLDEPAVHEQDWRLVIAEDTDELLRGDRSTGGLGTLLNVTDGLLGQGNRTMFLLTTNEPIGNLPPSLTRPGRCIAHIEFEPFNLEDARRWLDKSSAPPITTPMTLAELYESRDHTPLQDGSSGSGTTVGTYL